MVERTRRLQRIVRAQGQLKRAEEWKAANLSRRLAESREAERDIIAALNEDSALHGLFLDTVARRLRFQTEETGRLREACDLQSVRLRTAATRLKSAERLATEAETETRRSSDKADLDEVIEQLVPRGDASLR